MLTTMNIYAHSFKKMDEVASEALDKILNKCQINAESFKNAKY